MAIIFIILLAITIWVTLKYISLKKENKELNENITFLKSQLKKSKTSIFRKNQNDTTHIDQHSVLSKNVSSTNSKEKESESVNTSNWSVTTENGIEIPVSMTIETGVNDTDYNHENNRSLQEYQNICESRPDYNDQFGRPFDYPKYTDKYNTNTDFVLRELLLLVWWGKVKKGRLTTARIPKYFIYDYNLNSHKVTQKFIDKGLLRIENDRYVLSDEAKRIINFYSELWEMHQTTGIPICLDEDFTNWNHGKLLATFYQKEIEYFYKMITFYKKLIVFYKKHPNFYNDKLFIKHKIQDLNESISDIENDIAKDQQRIQAYK